MIRLIAATLALAVLWSGWWGYAAYRLKTGVETWFAERRAEGWEAQHARMRLRGFPNRLDLTLDDLLLADPRSGLVWEAPFFQIMSLSYKPGHVILVWPDRQALTTASGRQEITSDGLRASVVSRDGVILRANLEAEVLNIAGPERSLALAGVTAGALQDEGTQDLYRLGLSAEALARDRAALLPVGPDRLDGLKAQVAVTFDRPWPLDVLPGPRPQPERIDLRLAEYRDRGLELKLAGAVTVDKTGTPEGEMTLKAVNWREMLDQAEAAGRLSGQMTRMLDGALGLAAGLSGNRATLDLPLVLRDGQVTLGGIPVAGTPDLRLP